MEHEFPDKTEKTRFLVEFHEKQWFLDFSIGILRAFWTEKSVLTPQDQFWPPTGRTAKTVSNPLPILMEMCKIVKNLTFWCPKCHFLRCQICRWHFDHFWCFLVFFMEFHENSGFWPLSMGKPDTFGTVKITEKPLFWQKCLKLTKNREKRQKRPFSTFCWIPALSAGQISEKCRFWQV